MPTGIVSFWFRLKPPVTVATDGEVGKLITYFVNVEDKVDVLDDEVAALGAGEPQTSGAVFRIFGDGNDVQSSAVTYLAHLGRQAVSKMFHGSIRWVRRGEPPIRIRR